MPNTHDAATSPRARQKGHDIAELVVKIFAQLPPYIKMLAHVNINESPVLTHSSRELQDSNAMKVAGEKKERFCLVLFGHRLCHQRDLVIRTDVPLLSSLVLFTRLVSGLWTMTPSWVKMYHLAVGLQYGRIQSSQFFCLTAR